MATGLTLGTNSETRLPAFFYRLSSQARIVRIKQPMQLAARIARAHAADLDVDRRGHEAAADF
ncbi:MAG TPA: hypothetical protein VKG68_08860, partial [Candidatus Binatus sp.]|nr:hypothetical protein [Candidatus Binatus sp.]